MARLFFWIVFVPIAAAVVVFAVVNRDAVDVDLWPAPYAMTVPMWALVLGGALLGFLLGGLVAWAAGASTRADGRAARWRVASLERDLMLEKEKTAKLEKTAQAKAAAIDAPASDATLLAPD